ncbi:ROK family transcriptional regulator [Actinoplanes sp. ATCC 53533]|uniref:ROK family transcriptional regulator n=1 Tax=Actinoplanes sp. ATCC 53533 TaxID=1288362 RepID=UPI001F3BD578|nr:ROK family transcriptional regulator [Actinoplanes sp. ATCC 53533]
MRTTNLAVVLRFVRTHAPCSRADIAASTGLNKATVSSLVTDLLERRLLRETGLTENRIGRPASMLTLQSRPYAAIGIELAADHLVAIAVDLTGERLLTWRRAYPGLDGTAGRAEAAVAALAGRVVAKMAAQERRVLGLTVGAPGLVAPGGGVRFAPHLGRTELELGAALERGLRHPEYDVVIDSAANLAALAEHRIGAEADTPNMLTLIGDVEIGAGIVADGRTLRGARGFAGQAGHLQVDCAGPRCRCGRHGCLEAVAGLPALVRRALPDTVRDGPVTDFAPELERITALAGNGDAHVTAALAETGRLLGRGVSMLAELLDPQVVVLGGSFAALARWLLPAVEAELASRVAVPGDPGCRVTASTLHPDAAALGGAMLALDRLEDGKLPAPAA